MSDWIQTIATESENQGLTTLVNRYTRNNDRQGIPTAPQGWQKTMLDLLRSNQIEGFKIGSMWKIKKESVVEFLQYK